MASSKLMDKIDQVVLGIGERGGIITDIKSVYTTNGVMTGVMRYNQRRYRVRNTLNGVWEVVS